MSAGRMPTFGASIVSASAVKPAASARSTRLTLISSSLWNWSWSQQLTPVAATSSSDVLERLERTIVVAIEAAARAVATSPSGWTSLWNADGASINGKSNFAATISVERSGSATGHINRLWKTQRS